MYARYRTRSTFYKRRERPLRAYGVTPDILRHPTIKSGLLSGIYKDETVDMRSQERLEMLESMRHPRERDFYQDHTYHNQWVQRDLEQHQKRQIATRYRFFAPDYVITPWLWYPGDMVEVSEGESAGQRGTIIAVIKYKNEIVVQNVNVQDVVIPATDTRPEQVVQREHPISVLKVRHIDPSTNEMCNLDVVKVRNKETGEPEEKRISLQTGVLLPIPAPEEAMDVGDPLRDTPIQDADEATYDAANERGVLVERRLRAMEDYFIKQLKEAHAFHHPLATANAASMLHFQEAVLDRATEKLTSALTDTDTPLVSTTTSGVSRPSSSSSDPSVSASAGYSNMLDNDMPAWWNEFLAPYVADAEEDLAERLAQQREEEQLQMQQQQQQKQQQVNNNEDDEDDDNVVSDFEDVDLEKEDK